MLTPDYYDKCTKQLVELYAELDNAIISDITHRLVKTGEMTETAKWQAKQLQEAGMVYEDVLAEISARSGQSQEEIKRIFEEAGVTATRNDNVFAKAAGFKEIRTFSAAALQTLNAGYVKCSGDMSNLTLTTANASQQMYINAVNNAYMQITSGAFDYNTAIRNAVKAAAAEGAEVIYPSGHTDKLDVAVRRSVLTGVGQPCRKLSEINAQDMGTDLMEITAHAGARPSHAEWQGKVVSLSGRKGYLSKSDIGYGTGDGFGGWNCRHDWYPFFEGISTRAYSDERLKELNAKNIEYNGEMYSEYEISQMQRKMERDIRQLKREAVAADTGAKNAESEELAKQFSDDFTQTSVKLKAREQKLKDFLNETGQLPDGSRVWSNGFDRSVSQKAVHANKKEVDKYSAIHYNKDGTIVVTDDWKSKGKVAIPRKYKPNAVIETKTEFRDGTSQIDRTIYDTNGLMKTQIHSGGHHKSKQHPYGKNGEHHHYYTWIDNEKNPLRTTDNLTDIERKEHSDIL